jgi:hypothetical protein
VYEITLFCQLFQVVRRFSFLRQIVAGKNGIYPSRKRAQRFARVGRQLIFLFQPCITLA